MKDPDQKQLSHTSAKRLNILNKRLQQASKTFATYATCATSLDELIYFCNSKMKQLQHTFETLETLETYICNMGERPGRSFPALESEPAVSRGT
jgi:hypothetical protein